jgi:hypothetical protein
VNGERYNIVAIIPADAWSAMFLELETGETRTAPLMYFALVDGEGSETLGDSVGYRRVVGFSVAGCVEDDPTFITYLHNTETPTKYQARIREATEDYRHRSGVAPW